MEIGFEVACWSNRGRMIGLQSKGHEFDSWSGRYQVVITGMGDCHFFKCWLMRWQCMLLNSSVWVPGS